MTPERWAQIKEVFGAALEKPEAERSQFLDQACGSEAWLRDEVERLLAQSPGSLESPVAALAPPELTPGQTLGHYRVESKLGQGGMGVVYRAWDEQLRRPVALKTLSGRHFDDSVGRQRFLREARAASALNHPNIVTVHEVGSEGGVDFIAMEYIEGRSLTQLIPAKGLPLDRALDYAIATAGALAKAHAAGIVHRDLKPGNIMVTGDGLVKLLDFGLARRVRLPEAEATTLTHQGEILGTPAYMSPEQAEGKTADERSDIFSFGAVIYEMLCGRRAFTGDSTIAVLGAVLKEAPPPLTGVPAELSTLVERCLCKNPARRFQHMDDVRILLDELHDAAPQRWRAHLRAAVLCLIVIAAVAAIWFRARTAKPPNTEMRITPITNYPGFEVHPSFSPDGNQVAFVWSTEGNSYYNIYVKVVDSSAEPLRITSEPANDHAPAWSPDGRQLAFVREVANQIEVRLISALGGPERRLMGLSWADRVYGHEPYLCWSANGRWLAIGERQADGGWGISLLPVEPGQKRRLTYNSSGPDYLPAFSPDGRYLAYVSCPGLRSVACDVHLIELGPDLAPRGPPRRVTDQRTWIHGLAWAEDGRTLLYAARRCVGGPGMLWRVAISGKAGPERIDWAGPEVGPFAVSRAGRRLAFTRWRADSDIWKFEPGGSVRKFLSSTLEELNPQFSPDGHRIAFASNRAGGCFEIWTSASDGSNALQVTHGPGIGQGTPRWSPDGRWIAFDSLKEDGDVDVWVIDTAGRSPRCLTPENSDDSIPGWSRDSGWVYFRSNRSGRDEIWKIPFAGGQAVQVTDGGGYVAFESWDGKTLYYTKDRFTSPLFGRSLAGGPERQIIDRVSYRAFLPVRDGIYYIEPGQEAGVHVFRFHDFASAGGQELGRIEQPVGLGLAVSPDRKMVLFTGENQGCDLMLIENFQ